MDIQKAQELLDKHRAGTLTPEEKLWLDRWYLEVEAQQLGTDPSADLIEKQKAVFARIEESIRPRTVRLWPRIAAAASILLVCSTGAYFLLHHPKDNNITQIARNQDIAPLQKGVTLSLNGETIQLAKNHTGHIAANIDQADSSLQYKAAAAEPETNTLTNNGNSKFSVQLADGSAVTLDIGSSLTYPSTFKNTTRMVSLTGQAYFKVKHTAGQRFLVKTRNQITEDIGTEFNINAYDDEPAIRTTLLEGSIKVNDKLLKPGQQAINNGTDLKLATADIEEVTAWMQDKIVLEQQTLESILRKVARIYGVQIIYLDDEVKSYTYGGAVKTSTKLSSVLNYLRKAGGVDFKVEGKVIKVFKKKK